MRRFLLACAAVGLLATSGYAADVVSTGNIEKVEYVCMMQDMIMAKPGVKLARNGKVYWGCCEMCKAKMEAEPERYTRATDPVSGKVVDKAEASIYALKGTAYYFQSAKTRKQFSANPNKYLKK